MSGMRSWGLHRFLKSDGIGGFIDLTDPYERSGGLTEPVLLKFLEGDGNNIDLADSEGYTALGRSLVIARKDFTILLLKHGADVKISSKSGMTPLMSASINSWADIAKTILESIADEDEKVAYINSCDSEGRTALYFALNSGEENLASFLLDSGADPQISGTFETPLMAASRRGLFDIAARIRVSRATSSFAFGGASFPPDSDSDSDFNLKPSPCTIL